jgi:hypothetical protein
MGGADAVIFSGGIGEKSPNVRGRICEGLAWAGLKPDEKENQRLVGLEGQITSKDSSLHAYVIPTDGELRIARDTLRCIQVSHIPRKAVGLPPRLLKTESGCGVNRATGGCPALYRTGGPGRLMGLPPAHLETFQLTLAHHTILSVRCGTSELR